MSEPHVSQSYYPKSEDFSRHIPQASYDYTPGNIDRSTQGPSWRDGPGQGGQITAPERGEVAEEPMQVSRSSQQQHSQPHHQYQPSEEIIPISAPSQQYSEPTHHHQPLGISERSADVYSGSYADLQPASSANSSFPQPPKEASFATNIPVFTHTLI